MAKKLITEILRSRDCIVFFKGDTYTVTPSQAMLDQGWTGGQGVMWTPGSDDVRTVTFSNGLYGGYVLWGSDETADQWNAATRNQLTHHFVVMGAGGHLISTSTYEKYTWASRQGPGPLVPLVYQANDILYMSVRGRWTKEDEATLANLPHAPNFFTGFVAQVPRLDNGVLFLGIQTSM